MRGIDKGAGMRQATAAGVTLLVLALAAPVLAQEPKWGPHLDLEAKPGTKRALGEADLFIPVAQSTDTLLFANLRLRMDDNDGNEGNYGLGVRHMLDSRWNLGAYGYYDRRRSEYGNYFNQATFGVEALSQDWDARANYYAPVGRRSYQIDSLNAAEISGTSVVFRGGEERSMGGFDAELGWRVPVFDVNDGKALRVYGGGYRFTEDNMPAIEGPRFRAEMTFDSTPYLWDGSRFSLGAEWQHDDPRGSQGFLTARLRIPLQVYGKPSSQLTPMERRMSDPIQRDIDVVSRAGAFGTPEIATFTDGQAIKVINSAMTAGADLAAAVANAGANSTVLLSGNFLNVTNTVAVQAGQTLTAGTFAVRSASGRTAVLTTSATVSSSNVTFLFTTGGINGTINGLTINTDATLGTTIRVGHSGTTLSNNTINSGSYGIEVVAGQNVMIRGNTVTATSPNVHALYLSSGSSSPISATVTGNTLSSSAGYYMSYYQFSGSITVLGGSTGNVRGGGTCNVAGTISGAVGFTDGTTC